MTLANVGAIWYPEPTGGGNINFGGTNGYLIDAANEKFGCVFTVPKAGNIRKVHYRLGTVTTGATLDVRVETVDSSGLPTGTLWGTNTNASHVVASTDDDLWSTATATPLGNLTADAVVTSTHVDNSDKMAVVISQPGASFGNQYVASQPIGVASHAFPLGEHYTGGAWSKSESLARSLILLEYDDGSIPIIPAIMPMVACATTTRAAASNQEGALKFTQRFKGRVLGFWLHVTALWTAGRVQLYESGNNTPLTYCSLGTLFTSGGSGRNFYDVFRSKPTLSAGTTYYLSVLPTSGSITFRHSDVQAVGHWDSWPGGQDMMYSSRTRSGKSDPDTASWSDTTTRRPGFGLIFDQLDDGASSGGSTAYVIGG